MYYQMPQEVEVWLIIPALRSEIAKSMIEDYKFTQKRVSEYMNITEAAVSQYVSLKRAKEVVFSNGILDQINKSLKVIIENKEKFIPEMVRLCKLTEVRQVMCDLHKKQDVNLPVDCDVCFEEDIIKIK